MGIEFSNNFGDIAKQAIAQAAQQMEDILVEKVVATAREHGLTSADNIEIDAESAAATTGAHIDVERVRARANAILAG